MEMYWLESESVTTSNHFIYCNSEILSHYETCAAVHPMLTKGHPTDTNVVSSLNHILKCGFESY